MAGFEVEVGRGLRDAAGEVAAAWKAVGDGSGFVPTSRVCIADWDVLAELLTPRRLELLRHLRGSPEPNVRALARALGRDVKPVGEDVAALVAVGFAARDAAGRLSCDLDEVTAVVRLVPPAAGPSGGTNGAGRLARPDRRPGAKEPA